MSAPPPSGGGFDALYRSHVADVYRYCFVLLQDEERAEEVTRATFLDAFHALEEGAAPDSPHTWLIRIAHGLCRPDAEADEDPAPARASAPRRAHDLACDEAERAVSLQLDHQLPRREAIRLLSHLRRCEDCARFARRQRAQRSVLRGLAAVPLPESLPPAAPRI